MERNSIAGRLQETGILIITPGISGISAFLYGGSGFDIVKIVIMALAASGCMIFALEDSRVKNSLLFDNSKNIWHFSVLYLLFLLGSVVFPLLPEGGWPFLVVFTGLMLFSNQLVGMCAGSTLLMITVLLDKTASPELFLLYFIGGMTGILVFASLDESFKVGFPILISLLVQMVCICIHDVLLVNEILNPAMFLVPAVNTMVCLILLLIILKFFSVSSIYRTRDAYMDINDPECPLLVELKAFSKDEYYHAVHTAYLCDRIAKRLAVDDAAAKAGGYYHKIGILKGQNSWENAGIVLEEYHFPEMVHTILKEYLDKEEHIVSKETVILLISDTVISSISYLFSKNADVKLDYEKLIQAIFRKKLDSGILDYSKISISELEEMKKILMEETLYYDFLR